MKALLIGLALLAVLPSAALGQTRSDFAGLWWVAHGDGAPLQLRLYPDGSAWSDYPANNPGTWIAKGKRAYVVWADDWKEVILREGGVWEKEGYTPRTPFTATPNNKSRAIRATSHPNGWFGVRP